MNTIKHFGPKVKEIFTLLREGEKISFDSNKVGVTFSLKDVKGPSIIISGQKRLSRGRLIFTDTRVIGTCGGYKMIDFPLTEFLGKRVKVDISQPNRFIITIALQDFRPKWQGELSLAYHIQPDNIPHQLSQSGN